MTPPQRDAWRRRIESKLDLVLSKLQHFIQEETIMDQAITDALTELNATVASDSDVTSSAVTAITGLTTKIDQLLASSSDPAEVVAAIASANEAFKANTTSLAASVANIPPGHTA